MINSKVTETAVEFFNDATPGTTIFRMNNDGSCAFPTGTVTITGLLDVGATGLSDSDLVIESLNAMTIKLNDVDALQLDNAAIASFAAATATAGNDVYIETEDAGGTATAPVTGGLYNLKTGDGSASAGAFAGGAGGAQSLISGAGGAATGTSSLGDTGGAGGAIAITGGVGGATADDGAGEVGGAGAGITITTGAGGAASAGTANGGIGGALILAAAAGGTSSGGTAGLDAAVALRGLPVMSKKLNNAVGAAATLTTAQMLSGIITGTPTADPSAYTTPTGALLTAGFATQPATGDSFELSIINVAATGNTIELTAGDGAVTLVGDATIENITDAASGLGTTGTFQFVNTDGANAWSAYRK